MTLAELEKRLTALERTVAQLLNKEMPTPQTQRHWWRDGAGRFANDPVFDEIARLGREYRESHVPDYMKKKKPKKKRSANARS